MIKEKQKKGLKSGMTAYTVIRSKRKTMCIQIVSGGQVIVRCPMRTPQSAIDCFVTAQQTWIETHRNRVLQHELAYPEPEHMQRMELQQKARRELPALVERYATIMQVKPEGVRVTDAKKRFGSCSAKNHICFSWRLMQYPPVAIEYVVVHELAHIVHKNHGKEFYALIESVLPDYRERKKLLR